MAVGRETGVTGFPTRPPYLIQAHVWIYGTILGKTIHLTRKEGQI
jgi:hypothetical protein